MNSAEGGLISVLMLKGIHHICTRSSSKFQHTVKTCKTVLKHGFTRKRLREEKLITGPTGVKVQLDAYFGVSFPLGGLKGGAMKITAHEVESIGEFCDSPLGIKRFGRCSWAR